MASVEPVQDGCIHIEKINAPFMFAAAASSALASDMRSKRAGLSCARAGPMCG